MRLATRLGALAAVALAGGCGPMIEERLVGSWRGAVDGKLDRSKPLAVEFADSVKRDGPLSLTLRNDGTFDLSVDGMSGSWQRAGPMIVLTADQRPKVDKPVLGIQPVVRIQPLDQNRMKWDPTPGVTILWHRTR